MSQNQTSHAAVLGLDPEEIGNVLVRLGLTSWLLGHEHVTGTLRPYCSHPEKLSPEARFVYDMLTRPVPEVVERWYGGESDATVMLAIASERRYQPAAP